MKGPTSAGRLAKHRAERCGSRRLEYEGACFVNDDTEPSPEPSPHLVPWPRGAVVPWCRRPKGAQNKARAAVLAVSQGIASGAVYSRVRGMVRKRPPPYRGGL